MVPKVQMVGSRRRGTAIKPRDWDGEKTGSEACGTAPGSGWVLLTWDQVHSPLGLVVPSWPNGSCFSERSLVRAAHGEGPWDSIVGCS